MTQPKTLFQKIWERHVVAEEAGCPAILYIDLHLIHEVTSPQAFTVLESRGLKVRRPDRTVATVDHSTPTISRDLSVADAMAAKQVRTLYANAQAHGIRLYDMMNDKQGIVHMIGPELGVTQPGMTIVCGDSHTSTHGAFGSLAFGIGTSEVGYVLATQCLLQRKPKTAQILIDGTLGRYYPRADCQNGNRRWHRLCL
jgi:3-isopropylmalate/(R)-2-methylmalate dehydratase large subunit